MPADWYRARPECRYIVMKQWFDWVYLCGDTGKSVLEGTVFWLINRGCKQGAELCVIAYRVATKLCIQMLLQVLDTVSQRRDVHMCRY